MTSPTPTRWAVTCPTHGTVYLTAAEYERQLRQANDYWHCPTCGMTAIWDDENYDDPIHRVPRRHVEGDAHGDYPHDPHRPA